MCVCVCDKRIFQKILFFQEIRKAQKYWPVEQNKT